MEKAKVSIPTMFKTLREITSFPVIGRTTYHSKASGFWFCTNNRDAVRAIRQGATHFLKYIKNTVELRVHVFTTTLFPTSWEDYVSIKSSVKVPTVQKHSTVIKNFENGYRFLSASVHAKLPIDGLQKCRNVAKQAVYSLGLHFGAVDIVWSGATPYVLEVNTAPALTHTEAVQESDTLKRYVRAVKTYILKEGC
jgi:hypothetical protein